MWFAQFMSRSSVSGSRRGGDCEYLSRPPESATSSLSRISGHTRCSGRLHRHKLSAKRSRLIFPNLLEIEKVHNAELICHSGNGAPYGSNGILRPFAKKDTVWQKPTSAISSKIWSTLKPPCSAVHSSSEMLAESCNSSTNRISSRSSSDHTGSSEAPRTVARTCSGVSSTRLEKKVTCTPHS